MKKEGWYEMYNPLLFLGNLNSKNSEKTFIARVLFAITPLFCEILIYILPLKIQTLKWTQMDNENYTMKLYKIWIYCNNVTKRSWHLPWTFSVPPQDVWETLFCSKQEMLFGVPTKHRTLDSQLQR